MNAETIDEFINSYWAIGTPELASAFDFLIMPMRIGYFLQNALKRLCSDIYNRLDKIDMLIKMPEQGIFIYFLGDGPFLIADELGLMKKDKELKQRFNKIGKIGDFLRRNEENISKKVERYSYNPELRIVNVKNGKVPERKGDNKTESQVVIYNYNDSNLNLGNRKDRLKLKAIAAKDAKESYQKSQAEIVNRLKHNMHVWDHFVYCEKWYPSKFIAYLYFEFLYNHAHDSIVGSFDGNMYKDFMKTHQARVSVMLVECLSLLYPYALEAAGILGIDLEADENLQRILKLKGRLPELGNELDEYEEYARKVEEFEKKKQEKNQQAKLSKNQRRKANKKVLSEQIQATNKIVERKVEAIKAESTAVEVRTNGGGGNEPEVKQVAPFNEKKQQRKADLTEKTEAAKQAREEKEQTQEKRLKERSVKRAEEVVSEFKSEKETVEKAKATARMERIKNIHDLPSAEFVRDSIVNRLKGNNRDFFDMLFGFNDNDRTMNHENMLNLARYIRDL